MCISGAAVDELLDDRCAARSGRAVPLPDVQAENSVHAASLTASDQITMGRPKGSKNRCTILKEAEQHVGAKYVDQVLDSLYVLESAMRHFYVRAEMRKHTDDKPHLIDADFEKAAHLAALVAPYRHARLSAVKLAGAPSNAVPFQGRCER
jgi:hypothetical protein